MRISPARRALAAQFIRFAIVGFTAFVITTAVIYATRGLLGPALAGIPGFLVGITAGWLLNRSWTFKHRSSTNLFLQWLHYLVWTAPSTIITAATYEAAVLTSAFIAAHPIVGTALGAGAGMLVSFLVMRGIVFRQKTGDATSR